MPRQQYTRELKIATMRELEAGKSIAHVAREYQVSGSRSGGILPFPAANAKPRSRHGFAQQNPKHCPALAGLRLSSRASRTDSRWLEDKPQTCSTADASR
jgi:hypothetical protein